MKKAHLFIKADGGFIVEVRLGRARLPIVWGAVCAVSLQLSREPDAELA